MSSLQSLQRQDELLDRLLLKLPIEQELRRREQAKEMERVRRNADAIRRRCKTLAGFIKEAWHVVEPHTKYVHGWHIDAKCQHLEAITFGRFLDLKLLNRLLINEPPGHMKSLVVSVFWQAWEWGPCNMPGLKYFSTSYNEKYVNRDARKTRDLILSEWYQTLWPHVKLVRTGESSFENSEKGTREGMPFRSLTGGRGDRLLIDDPHSTETAESDADRETAERIFRESATTRLNDAQTSAIVIIMQRLHEADVAGTAIKLGDYIHLRLPMEFEADADADDPLSGPCETPIFSDPRKYDGELLFPERFPRTEIDKMKVTMGDYAVAGQFQQRPTTRGGAMFRKEDFEIIPALPHGNSVVVRGWDLAATERAKNKRAAATAGVKLREYTNGLLVIEDIAWGQLNDADAEKLIVNTASQDGATVDIDLPLDPGQASKTQIRYLVTHLRAYTVRWSPESGEKEVRAGPVASQARVGNIKLLKGAWNHAFLEEAALFPRGLRKDRIDALSRAYAALLQKKAFIPSIAAPRILNLNEQSEARPNGAR